MHGAMVAQWTSVPKVEGSNPSAVDFYNLVNGSFFGSQGNKMKLRILRAK